MLIISEKQFTKEQRKLYESKGVRYAYGYENIYPHKGEAVGFILDKLYANTIDRIGYYLKTKHKVTIRYNENLYQLDNYDEWKKTYQDPKDQIKTKTELHPVLKEYYDKRKEYFERKKDESIKMQYYAIYQLDPAYQNITDEELQSYIKQVAPMYEIDVDYSNRLDMLRAYIQLHYYLENDIEYSRPASDIQIIPVGNPMLFDDLIYKVQNSSIPVDNIIQSMLKLD